MTTKHVAEGMALDYDTDGYISGGEIFDVQCCKIFNKKLFK